MGGYDKKLEAFLEHKAPALYPAEAIKWIKENCYVDAEKIYWLWRYEYVRSENKTPQQKARRMKARKRGKRK